MTESEPDRNGLGLESDPLAAAARWHEEGCGVAIATVIETWGSSPRPVGSQLAFDADGRFAGSVSGGCIEGSVIVEGRETIRDGQPRILAFEVSDERAWEIGLICGGAVHVYLERLED